MPSSGLSGATLSALLRGRRYKNVTTAQDVTAGPASRRLRHTVHNEAQLGHVKFWRPGQ